jgi:NitT/TauT family transport system ATP-binding protein
VTAVEDRVTDVDAPAVRCVGIEKHFRGRGRTVHALGPVDLDIPRGQFCCIVGPSGCGKSTLLRLIAGLAPPTAGSVELSIEAASNRPSAIVFQDYGIFPWKSVVDNVALGLQLQGSTRREARQQARSWCDRFGLGQFVDAFPRELSGGMRQRVAIARAMAAGPDVLLMDEPFAALDVQLRTLMQEELLRVWEADERTVVFVTHSLEEAIVLGDRVLVMSKRPGRVLADVQVPLPRPRQQVDVSESAAFWELRASLWELLRGEVDVDGSSTAGD